MNIAMSNPTGKALYDRESAAAIDALMDEADQLMAEFGTPASLIVYVHLRKGWMRKLYPTAAWVRDGDLRRRLALANGLHCLGLKLLDDIIDEDTDFRGRELIVGQQFCMRALELVNEAGALPAFFRDYQAVWGPITRHITKEPTTPILSLKQWEQSANVKAGDVLAAYARFCFCAEDRLDEFEAVRPAFHAFGTIFTVLNDYLGRDRPTEAHSNLFALIGQGVIQPAEVADLIRTCFDRFESCLAANPPELDFHEPLTETRDTFLSIMRAIAGDPT